jgi:hypothetical protein
VIVYLLSHNKRKNFPDTNDHILTNGLRLELEDGRDEDVDREGSDYEGDGGDEDASPQKQEYVKKVFVAHPYVSPFGTDVEVRNLIVKNAR